MDNPYVRLRLAASLLSPRIAQEGPTSTNRRQCQAEKGHNDVVASAPSASSVGLRHTSRSNRKIWPDGASRCRRYGRSSRGHFGRLTDPDHPRTHAAFASEVDLHATYARLSGRGATGPASAPGVFSQSARPRYAATSSIRGQCEKGRICSGPFLCLGHDEAHADSHRIDVDYLIDRETP